MATTTIAINVTLPPDLVKRVEALAREQRRSRSNMIVQLLIDAMSDLHDSDEPLARKPSHSPSTRKTK
jgi:metal-responsive CopG/Arc/MetJ family transcriptional regulator